MVALAQELAGEGLDGNSRQLAGLHLKNLLFARDSYIASEKKKTMVFNCRCALTGSDQGFVIRSAAITSGTGGAFRCASRSENWCYRVAGKAMA